MRTLIFSDTSSIIVYDTLYESIYITSKQMADFDEWKLKSKIGKKFRSIGIPKEKIKLSPKIEIELYTLPELSISDNGVFPNIQLEEAEFKFLLDCFKQTPWHNSIGDKIVEVISFFESLKED